MASNANGGEIRARITLENSQFKRNMRETRDQMQGLAKDTQSAKDKLDKLQHWGSVAALGVAGVGAAAVITAANFEQSMARVGAMSEATGEEFDRLRQAAIDAGSSTVFSSSQAADALSFLAQAGFDVNQQIAAMPSVLDLAAASQVDLAQSADIVASIMNGFGIAATDTAHATDVLTKATVKSNSDITDLSQAMKYVGPVAHSLGWTLEDTATAIGMMSNAGIKGSEAGTSLRGMLLALLTPSNKAAKEMENLGIKITDSKGHMKDLPDLMASVEKGFSKLTKAQKGQAAAILVGREASAGFLTLMENSPEKLAAFSNGLKDADGYAHKLADTQNDTLIGSWKEFQSAVEKVGIQLGDALAPELRDLVDWLTGIADKLGDMDPFILEFGLKFAAAATSVLVATAAVKKITFAIKALMVTTEAAEATNPFGWVLIATTLLAGLVAGLAGTHEETEKLQTINLEQIKTDQKQVKTMQDKLDKFNELKKGTKNANDTLGKFLDIQSQINETKSPEKIEELKKKQDDLAKSSGTTVDKLQQMADINGDIVNNTPEVVTSYSKQGNAIAGNTDLIQKQIDKKLQNMRIDAQQKAKAALDNAKKAAPKYKNDLETMAQAQKKMKELQDSLPKLKDQLADAKKDIMSATTDAELATATGKVSAIESQINSIDDKLADSKKNFNDAFGDKQKIEKAMGGYKGIFDQLVNIELETVGINKQGQAGIDILKKTISNESTRYKRLQDIKESQGGLNAKQQKEYDTLQSSLSTHITTLNTIREYQDEQGNVIGYLDKMNDQAGTFSDKFNQEHDMQIGVQTVDGQNFDWYMNHIDDVLSGKVTKPVEVTDGGTVNTLNAGASSPVRKPVTLFNTNLTPFNMTVSGPVRKGVSLFGLNWDPFNTKVESPLTKGVNLEPSNLSLFNSNIADPIYKPVYLTPHYTGNWSGPSGKRHMGGPTYDLPKYHTGGNVKAESDQMSSFFGRLMPPPKMNEVDARLLRDEMVLTNGQQENLFRLLQTFGNIQAAELEKQAKGIDGGDGATVINVESMVVREEADITRIASELDRLQKYKKRGKGGR